MAMNVQLLFGPMLIGAFFNCILYGVLALQMFIYYQTYGNDVSWLRYFMLYLFILETVNTACDMLMLYQPLVLEYAQTSATTAFPWTLAADPLVTVLISTPIQVFIAWRIWIISRSKYIPIFICALAAVALGGGVWLTTTVIHIREFKRKPELHDPALVWLVASAIADAAITGTLVQSLSRRKTGMSMTDSAIDKMIRLTIQTGLVTTIFAALDVICFLALPRTTLNFTWDFSLSKLYTNALLSTLNARVGLNPNNYRSSGIPRDNLLFGREDHSPIDPTRTSTNFEVMMTSQFEMEPTKTTDEEWSQDRSRPGSHTRKSRSRDLEIGIAVAQEVRVL